MGRGRSGGPQGRVIEPDLMAWRAMVDDAFTMPSSKGLDSSAWVAARWVHALCSAAFARPAAIDAQPRVLEGEWHGSRTVVLEFESVAAARAWYESEEYQKAIPLCRAAAKTNAVIISGLPEPS